MTLQEWNDNVINALDAFVPKPTPPLPLEKPFGIYITKQTPKPKRIIRNGKATVVFWDDGSKTIVKRAEGESDSPYTAFTAALAIKIFGSNSAVHRIVGRTEGQEQKEKQKDCAKCKKEKTYDECFDCFCKAMRKRILPPTSFKAERADDGSVMYTQKAQKA